MERYAGKHPVFVSHTKEIEQLLSFLANLEHRLKMQGKIPEKPEENGPMKIEREKYHCLLRVREKCRELLLRLSAEESEITLLDEADTWWMRNIICYVHDVILKDRKKVG